MSLPGRFFICINLLIFAYKLKTQEMTINLTEINSDFIPPRTGKYLVRTKTELGHQFVQAHVELLPKGSKHEYSIDVHNQIPTHISTEPIL